MNVLFFAKTKVFSRPVSANVSSGPRFSNGMGSFRSPLIYPGQGVFNLAGGVYSVVEGSFVVVSRNGGSVSEKKGKLKLNYKCEG